jgi:DNA-binding PadR family transcriptional regulator
VITLPKQDYYRQGQLTDVAYLVLVCLTVPCHGYLIMSKVEEMTEGGAHIGPATLYTTLRKLTEANFIRLRGGGARKVYCLTDEGLETLRVEIDKRERYAAYGRRALEEKM